MMTANLVNIGITLLVVSGLSNQLIGNIKATGVHVHDEF